MRGLQKRVAALAAKSDPGWYIYIRSGWQPWAQTEEEWRADYEAIEDGVVRDLRNGVEVRFVIFDDDDRRVMEELTARANDGEIS